MAMTSGAPMRRCSTVSGGSAAARERSKQPYSPAEIGSYLALVDAQQALERRMRAAVLVCLGAGAGLIRGDLREVRGTDVACRSGGVVVYVRAAARTWCRCWPATTPGCWPRRGPPGPGQPADQGSGRRWRAARLNTGQLRATWLRDCVEPPGLATFMHAAGITCSQRPGDLLAALDQADEATAVALPGATR